MPCFKTFKSEIMHDIIIKIRGTCGGLSIWNDSGEGDSLSLCTV